MHLYASSDFFKCHPIWKVVRNTEFRLFSFLLSTLPTMVATSWQDKKLVSFISNIYSNKVIATLQRQNKEQVKSLKYRPAITADYTQRMGNVDSFNAKLFTNLLKRWNCSWKRTQFFILMKMSLVNVMVLSKYLELLRNIRCHTRNHSDHCGCKCCWGNKTNTKHHTEPKQHKETMSCKVQLCDTLAKCLSAHSMRTPFYCLRF